MRKLAELLIWLDELFTATRRDLEASIGFLGEVARTLIERGMLLPWWGWLLAIVAGMLGFALMHVVRPRRDQTEASLRKPDQ